ncbi:MAG: 23S rRNA (pseudouridine(1915)-N(3))-methyltransferase RlmH [Bacilli bacterium]|nr:23S rRNA (pseudouridine(1915)-N(3))-methyltransferase RlmH [Bacilli bacterium]
MITIICVGKIKEHYLKDMIDDYLKRISKYHKINIIELKDSNIKNEEGEILKVLKPNAYNIALDINGNSYSSIELASKIDRLFTINSNICFIIGGSDGIGEKVKKSCQELLTFSKLTFPHGLFRGILLEQIYRSFKIINNETYHK